jgi:hypothetical protein
VPGFCPKLRCAMCQIRPVHSKGRDQPGQKGSSADSLHRQMPIIPTFLTFTALKNDRVGVARATLSRRGWIATCPCPLNIARRPCGSFVALRIGPVGIPAAQPFLTLERKPLQSQQFAQAGIGSRHGVRESLLPIPVLNHWSQILTFGGFALRKALWRLLFVAFCGDTMLGAG